jgi:hypothetical protein
MAAPLDILVLSVPGLSARMLREHADRLPHLRALAEHSAASVVVLDDASTEQLEAALVTGMLPEFLGTHGTGVGESRGQPFWQKAGADARVEMEHPLPPDWRAFAKTPRLDWRTLPLLTQAADPGAALAELDAAVAAAPHQPLVVLSAWALADGVPGGQNAAPLDRPVLLARGFEQTKTCVGILEIAGLLERALTGERLSDAI